jgi:hypothetical protein
MHGCGNHGHGQAQLKCETGQTSDWGMSHLAPDEAGVRGRSAIPEEPEVTLVGFPLFSFRSSLKASDSVPDSRHPLMHGDQVTNHSVPGRSRVPA